MVDLAPRSSAAQRHLAGRGLLPVRAQDQGRSGSAVDCSAAAIAVSDFDETVRRLHAHGLIDFHFDLPMELLDKKNQPEVLAREFLPQLRAGGVGAFVAAIYIEDKYLPDGAFQV